MTLQKADICCKNGFSGYSPAVSRRQQEETAGLEQLVKKGWK